MIRKFQPLKKLAKELAVQQEKVRMKQLQELAEKKKEYQKQAKGILKACISDFMKEHPTISAIGWVQYTPYFNDGDECVFGMHEVQYSTQTPFTEETAESSNHDDEVWRETYGSYGQYNAGDDIDKQSYEDLQKLNRTLQTLSEEMRIVFGDHTRVVVTQSGVYSFEYSHD